jgi:hypothetical protein
MTSESQKALSMRTPLVCCDFMELGESRRARFMFARTGNLHFVRTRFFTGLAAIFLARLCHAVAWQVSALNAIGGRHVFSLILLLCKEAGN